VKFQVFIIGTDRVFSENLLDLLNSLNLSEFDHYQCLVSNGYFDRHTFSISPRVAYTFLSAGRTVSLLKKCEAAKVAQQPNVAASDILSHCELLSRPLWEVELVVKNRQPRCKVALHLPNWTC
jgi:hypothetical protein